MYDAFKAACTGFSKELFEPIKTYEEFVVSMSAVIRERELSNASRNVKYMLYTVYRDRNAVPYYVRPLLDGMLEVAYGDFALRNHFAGNSSRALSLLGLMKSSLMNRSVICEDIVFFLFQYRYYINVGGIPKRCLRLVLVDYESFDVPRCMYPKYHRQNLSGDALVNAMVEVVKGPMYRDRLTGQAEAEELVREILAMESLVKTDDDETLVARYTPGVMLPRSREDVVINIHRIPLNVQEAPEEPEFKPGEISSVPAREVPLGAVAPTDNEAIAKALYPIVPGEVSKMNEKVLAEKRKKHEEKVKKGRVLDRKEQKYYNIAMRYSYDKADEYYDAVVALRTL